MSAGPVSSTVAANSLDRSGEPRAPLPPSVDGNDVGRGGWQPATDPHAQPGDGTLAESTVLASGSTSFITRERSTGYDGIVVTTTNQDDKVSVQQRPDGTVDVTVNGETTNLRLAPGQQLEIRSEGGDDTVEIDPQVTANVTVYGGEGNDTLTARGDGSISMAPGQPSPDRGNTIQLNGESGDDTIQAFATQDASGASARVAAYGNDGNDQISVIGDGGLVIAGDGDDTIAVFGQDAKVHAGAGDDTVNTRGNGVGVNTGGGRDQVNVLDGDAKVAGDFNFFSFFTGEHDTVNVDPGATATELPREE